VVGAGVIGLAVARELAMRGRTVLVAEAATTHGSHISSRNSEVIHAGIYYPKDSLKARLCVRGRELLYAYCTRHGVSHRRLGKWIVATHEGQSDALQAIARAATGNGVSDVHFIDGAHARAIEPNLRCTSALVSPSSGIVDSHAYMLALLGEAEDHGATLALRSRVDRIGRAGSSLRVRFEGDPGFELDADWVINCAGLDAPSLATRIEDFPSAWIPTPHYAKGSYFTLTGRSPFSRLIYPVPEPGGLGVHLTLDLNGQARFGPDVEWVERPDYVVDARRASSFYPVIRSYWPGLPDGSLQPAYAGVRPKISGADEPAADFRIDDPSTHGADGVINLFGIESPGLTASLALAQLVADRVR
jgi:L-2-hydroxyglutarate oxidase LhgO